MSVAIAANPLDNVRKLFKRSDKPVEEVESKDVEEKYQQAKQARLPLERQWMENYAFYRGKQWLVWNDSARILEVPPTPEWQVLVTVNLVRPTITTEYAKLIQERPTASVSPLSSEPSDIRLARTNNKILDYLWKPTGSEDAKNDALLWALLLGTGIIKYYWDPDKGDKKFDPERGIEFALGEICALAVSPFEFYNEPLSKRIADMQYAFHAKLRSAEYVNRKWHQKIEEEDYGAEDHLEGRLNGLMDLGAEARYKGVLVREFFEVPTEKYPQGRYIVHAGDKLLEARINPEKKCPIPFVAWQHLRIPGSFWGDGRVNDLLDPQRNYNKARSQAIQIRNLMAKPKWLKPIGSIPAGIHITSAPGEEIDYIPIAGMKPESIAGKDVPTTFWRDLEQTRLEINEVSGQHDVSRSQVPGQVKAGVAIQALQEQDDLRLGPAAQTFENAIGALESGKLKLAKAHYQETRYARILGEGQRTEVIQFTQDDIMDEADVQVRTGSSLPKSRVAKLQFLTELWQLGILQDQRLVLRLMEFEDVEGVFDEVNRDINQAERENDKMKMGGAIDPNTGQPQVDPNTGQPVPIPVHDYDNQEIHIYTHNKERKSEEFENAPQEVQAAFQAHVDQHKQYLMMAQASAPAGPDGQPAQGQGGGGMPKSMSGMQSQSPATLQ